MSLGQDVESASTIGGSEASDEWLLNRAHEDGRVLITRDRDFGALVFLRGEPGAVIYLRILPSTIRAVHQELQTVLSRYSETELEHAFIVVEAGRHRFRRLPE